MAQSAFLHVDNICVNANGYIVSAAQTARRTFVRIMQLF